MLKGMTVEYLIRRTFRVEPGMTVLCHAAAGGVGLIACQWLSALGATVIGTVGIGREGRARRAHGCDAHDRLHDARIRRARARAHRRQGRAGRLRLGRAATRSWAPRLPAPARLARGLRQRQRQGRAVRPGLLSQKGSLYLTRPTLFAYTAERSELLASAGGAVRRDRRAARCASRCGSAGSWPTSPRPTARSRVARRWARRSCCRSSGAARSTAVAVAEPVRRADRERNETDGADQEEAGAERRIEDRRPRPGRRCWRRRTTLVAAPWTAP